jgi:hypothetical protein
MITVVTLGRSASNWYCSKLARDYGYECLFEVLHDNNTYLKYFLKHRNNKKIVIKLIPYQFGKVYSKKHVNLLNDSERVIFLIRKDYQAQMRSSFAGTYAKNKYNIEFHDEFNDPITIPTEYIEEHWDKQLNIFLQSFNTIRDLYINFQNINKSVVYTEDVIKSDNRKLNRPFIFEKELWYPEINYSDFEK